MVAQLTKHERQLALNHSTRDFLIWTRDGGCRERRPAGVHGAIVLLAASPVRSGHFRLLRTRADDSRSPLFRRPSQWDSSRHGVARRGPFVGDWIAWSFQSEPDIDAAWSSFGRLRPVAYLRLIFGFGGNA